VAVIFDLSEKMDDFMEKGAPFSAIVFDYYLNFIPYFANLFSSLFTFIAVIFFTSKMAYNTEIISILASGVSYRRMLYPYLISAFVIFSLTYALSGYIIPPANKTRLEFEAQYLKKRRAKSLRNIHRQINPGEFVYMSSFNSNANTGYSFSMEKFENEELKSKLLSDYIKYDTASQKWKIKNYYIRTFDGINEEITSGKEIDTVLNMKPDDFKGDIKVIEAMNNLELNDFIEQNRMQGSDYIEEILVERYNRLAIPFSTFILTLIGVSLSSRKVRGGMGLHIGIGIGLSFVFILFQRFAASFAISGTFPALISVWIPNTVFFLIAVYLYFRAPK